MPTFTIQTWRLSMYVILFLSQISGKAPVPYKHGSSRRSPVHAGDDLGSYGISPIDIMHAGSRRDDPGRDPCRRLLHPWRTLELRGRPGGQQDSFTDQKHPALSVDSRIDRVNRGGPCGCRVLP